MKTIDDWHSTYKFWENTIKSITLEKGYPDDWIDIFNREFNYANGTPFEFPEDFTGIGVYECKSNFLSKGIRILPELDEDSDAYLYFYIEIEREYLDIYPPCTLTIRCHVNESNFNEMQNLLRKWIDTAEIKDVKDLE